MPLALFRCDASTRIGAGHVIRSMVLADALYAVGWECAFVTRATSLKSVPALANSRMQVIVLEGPAQDEPLQIAAATGGAADLMVVDHYERGEDFERACRGSAKMILVIDDATGRRHDCDFLLDAATRGPDRLATGTRQFLGPVYALLRSDFHRLRYQSLSRRKTNRGCERIVVSFGMIDASDRTGAILPILNRLLPRGCRIDILIGTHASGFHFVRNRAAESALDVEVHVDASDVPEIMAAADIALGAGGMTSWERCCLGIPALVVVTATNQLPNAAILREAGAAIIIGDGIAIDERVLEQGVKNLTENPIKYWEMSGRSAALCDGLGPQRVAIGVSPEVIRGVDEIRLRPVTTDDADTMFEWQRDPSTRRYFRNPLAPSHDEHCRWLKSKLTDNNCIFNVVTLNDREAGVLRLDRIGDSSYEISILTAPKQKRRGVASAALRLARRLCPAAELRADVLDENEASARLFSGCGYRRSGDVYISKPMRLAHA